MALKDSQQTRINYPNAPIAEAIIDIRVEGVGDDAVEQIDRLGATLNERYPSSFPIQSVEFGFQTALSDGQELKVQSAQARVGSRFVSASSDRIAQLRRDGFTFSQLPPYRNWETLRTHAQEIWLPYVEAATIKTVSRVAVRIINRIHVPGDKVDLELWSKLYPKIPSTLPEDTDGLMMQVQFPINRSDLDARCIINFAGGSQPAPGLTELILDIDVFAQVNMPAQENALWDMLDLLSIEKNTVFESCITDKTRELFI